MLCAPCSVLRAPSSTLYRVLCFSLIPLLCSLLLTLCPHLRVFPRPPRMALPADGRRHPSARSHATHRRLQQEQGTFSVLCALRSVLCAMCSVLCPLCSVLCALCSVVCAL